MVSCLSLGAKGSSLRDTPIADFVLSVHKERGRCLGQDKLVLALQDDYLTVCYACLAGSKVKY